MARKEAFDFAVISARYDRQHPRSGSAAHDWFAARRLALRRPSHRGAPAIQKQVLRMGPDNAAIEGQSIPGKNGMGRNIKLKRPEQATAVNLIRRSYSMTSSSPRSSPSTSA